MRKLFPRRSGRVRNQSEVRKHQNVARVEEFERRRGGVRPVLEAELAGSGESTVLDGPETGDQLGSEHLHGRKEELEYEGHQDQPTFSRQKEFSEVGFGEYECEEHQVEECGFEFEFGVEEKGKTDGQQEMVEEGVGGELQYEFVVVEWSEPERLGTSKRGEGAVGGKRRSEELEGVAEEERAEGAEDQAR